MAGGRSRRRRNSKTGSIKSAASDLAEEQQQLQQSSAAPLAIPEEPTAPHNDDSEAKTEAANQTENAGTPALDDSYDPFAYDSDLETLSSVSSHSSISSSAGSMLDEALGLPAAADDQDQDHDHDHEEHLSDIEDMDDADQAQDEQEDAANGKSNGNARSSGIKGNQDDAKSGDSVIRADEDPLLAAAADSKPASEKTGSDSHGSEDENEDVDADVEHASAKPLPHAGLRYLTKPSSQSAAASLSSARRVPKRSLMYGGCDSKSDADTNGNDDDAMDEDATTKFPVLESIANTPENSTDSPRVNGADMDMDSEQGDEQSRAETGSIATDKEEQAAEEDEDVLENEARRSAALMELTCIEIEFAKLRERLYCERLQQVQIEEEYLVSGQHSDYERHVEDISSNYKLQMERLQNRHHAWLQLRQKQHESWMQSVNYTYLVQRQELRSRLLEAQRRRLWRLRDMRMQEDRRYAETTVSLQIGASNSMAVAAAAAASSFDEDMALITQQLGGVQQLKRARRATHTAQRCLVHRRKQCLAAPGLDPEEMDSDYLAMQMPLYPRERHVGGFRRIYVPPPVSETGAVAGKKRKPRQPRQPRKKQALDGGGSKGTAGLHKRAETNGNKAVSAGVHAAIPESKTGAVGNPLGNGMATAPRAFQQQGQQQPLPGKQLSNRPQTKAPSFGNKQVTTASVAAAGSSAYSHPNPNLQAASTTSMAKKQNASPASRKVEPAYAEPHMAATTAAAPKPAPGSAASNSSASASASASASVSAPATADGSEGKSDGRGSVDMHVPPGSTGPVGLKA